MCNLLVKIGISAQVSKQAFDMLSSKSGSDGALARTDFINVLLKSCNPPKSEDFLAVEAVLHRIDRKIQRRADRRKAPKLPDLKRKRVPNRQALQRDISDIEPNVLAMPQAEADMFLRMWVLGQRLGDVQL